MRKNLKLRLVIAIILVMISTMPVFGANDIAVYKDGQKIEFDAPIYIKDGLTMIPMSNISSAIGFTATWNNETKTAYIITRKYDNLDNEVNMSFTIGQTTAHYKEFNQRYTMGGWVENIYADEDRQIGTTIEIANGRVMLPLRFLAENLGLTVQWDNATRRIDISKYKAPETPLRTIDGHTVTEEEWQRAINEQYVDTFEDGESDPDAFQ